jgi:hypothetical protein
MISKWFDWFGLSSKFLTPAAAADLISYINLYLPFFNKMVFRAPHQIQCHYSVFSICLYVELYVFTEYEFYILQENVRKLFLYRHRKKIMFILFHENKVNRNHAVMLSFQLI